MQFLRPALLYDGGGGCQVAEALGFGGGDDGEHGDAAETEADVYQAEQPAQEAVPKGQLPAIKPHHPQVECLFAEAAAVEKVFAYQVVEADEDTPDDEAGLACYGQKYGTRQDGDTSQEGKIDTGGCDALQQSGRLAGDMHVLGCLYVYLHGCLFVCGTKL